MRERYVVSVARVVRYEAEIEVDAENPGHARMIAKQEAERRGFAWSEDSDEVTTGDIVVPADQPKRRRRS